jgi:opacity protein-like surface antigen
MTAQSDEPCGAREVGDAGALAVGSAATRAKGQGDNMDTKLFWALSVMAASASAVAQEPYYQPPPNYQPPPSYQPPPNYQQPPPNYQQPPPNYQQPPPNYQQPPPNYQQPPPGYQQPPPGYQQPPPYPPPPPPGYQQPQTKSAQPQKNPQQLQYHPFRFQIEGGYTFTEGSLKDTLNDGGNVGAGITWFPSSVLPIGLRVDGSYSTFNLTQPALAAAGNNLSSGHQNVYGGDADAEIDLPMTPRAREYFFGGFGWYRTQTVLKQTQYEQGLVCGFFFCEPGEIPVVTTVQKTTSDWVKSWNAGIGFEFALSDPVTLFIDARYITFEPYNSKTQFIPIRIGLRF